MTACLSRSLGAAFAEAVADNTAPAPRRLVPVECKNVRRVKRVMAHLPKHTSTSVAPYEYQLRNGIDQDPNSERIAAVPRRHGVPLNGERSSLVGIWGNHGDEFGVDDTDNMEYTVRKWHLGDRSKSVCLKVCRGTRTREPVRRAHGESSFVGHRYRL